MILGDPSYGPYLRELELTDAQPFYLAMLRDASVMLGDHFPKGLGELTLDLKARIADPLLYLFGIFRPNPDATETHLGNIQLRLAPEHRRGEVGVIVDKASQRKHAALTAHIALLDWAFAPQESEEGLGLHKVVAGYHFDNHPSQRLYKALGFGFEGLFHEHEIIHDTFRDIFRVGMLADEWRRIRNGEYLRPRVHPLVSGVQTEEAA